MNLIGLLVLLGLVLLVEEELDDPKTGPQMDTSNKVNEKLRGNNQALPKDYEKSGYQIGHLYPHCHNCDQNQAESSFTLTNAAPQDEEDNTDWYGQVEKVTANIIYNWCQKPAYVVTGVVPGDKWVGYDGTNRVNVPSYFWSAFCCIHRVTSNYLSMGFLATTKTGMEKEFGKHPNNAWRMVADRMSVGDLNDKLKDLYKSKEFKVFGNVCK